MNYRTANGEQKHLGDFDHSTQREFDEALASLPELINKSRQGDVEAGYTANDLLWKLANESFNTRDICPTTFQTISLFGKKED
jgi:hypothetical protein